MARVTVIRGNLRRLNTTESAIGMKFLSNTRWKNEITRWARNAKTQNFVDANGLRTNMRYMLCSLLMLTLTKARNNRSATTAIL